MAQQMLTVGACVVENVGDAVLNDHVLVEICFESAAFQTLCTGRVVTILPGDRAAIQLRELFKFEREALDAIPRQGSGTWYGWQDGLDAEGLNEAS